MSHRWITNIAETTDECSAKSLRLPSANFLGSEWLENSSSNQPIAFGAKVKSFGSSSRRVGRGTWPWRTNRSWSFRLQLENHFRSIDLIVFIGQSNSTVAFAILCRRQVWGRGGIRWERNGEGINSCFLARVSSGLHRRCREPSPRNLTKGNARLSTDSDHRSWHFQRMIGLEILLGVGDAQLFEAIPVEVLQPEDTPDAEMRDTTTKEIGEKLPVEDVEALRRQRWTFASVITSFDAQLAAKLVSLKRPFSASWWQTTVQWRRRTWTFATTQASRFSVVKAEETKFLVSKANDARLSPWKSNFPKCRTAERYRSIPHWRRASSRRSQAMLPSY